MIAWIIVGVLAGGVVGLFFYARFYQQALKDARDEAAREREYFRAERDAWSLDRTGLTNRQLLYRGSPTLEEDIAPVAPEMIPRPPEPTTPDEARRNIITGAFYGTQTSRGPIAARQQYIYDAALRNQSAGGAPPRSERSPFEPIGPSDVTEEDLDDIRAAAQG